MGGGGEFRSTFHEETSKYIVSHIKSTDDAPRQSISILYFPDIRTSVVNVVRGDEVSQRPEGSDLTKTTIVKCSENIRRLSQIDNTLKALLIWELSYGQGGGNRYDGN